MKTLTRTLALIAIFVSGIVQAEPAAPNPEGIRLNFKEAPLSEVLNYLSEAAGFVIVQESPVTGNISVMSARPVNADEAVDLLNAVLLEKGFVAIRSGRILKIVSRKSAPKRDIPVKTGSDPKGIPRKDEMVTQVIPVHYADAAKLVENIKPLLAEESNLSSNQSSNAIILTDTQANVRRIAEIIQALDTSIADIGEVRVFRLNHADANELAGILNGLYADNSNSNPALGGAGGNAFQRFINQGGRSSGQNNQLVSQPNERALLQSKVKAVGDPRTNSLLVTATRETMAQIADMVTRLDSSGEKKQKVYIYSLQYADVNNVASILKGIFNQQTGAGGQNNTQNQAAGSNRLNQRSANGAANQGNTSSSNNNRNANR